MLIAAQQWLLFPAIYCVLVIYVCSLCEPDGSVGIATDYAFDAP